MKKVAATLGLALIFASHGTVAMPLYDGTYNLNNGGSSYNRGIWTNVGSFSTVSGTFSVTGNTAQLAGDVFSTTYNGGLTFAVDMTYLCTSSVSNAGGNYVSVDNAGCGLPNQPTGGPVSGAEADGNIWDFWNWSSPSTLIGYGALDGLEIYISQKPDDLSKPFRVGTAADWDDDDLLGGSGWMNLDLFSCASGAACENADFNPRSADFNFRFNAAVPAPTPLILIALGLMGIGAARRRS